MENRFLLEDFTELQKLALVYGFIAGEARSWYVWRQSLLLFKNWEEIKQGLLLRFGREDDPERITVSTEHERWREKLKSWASIHEKRTSMCDASIPGTESNSDTEGFANFYVPKLEDSIEDPSEQQVDGFVVLKESKKEDLCSGLLTQTVKAFHSLNISSDESTEHQKGNMVWRNQIMGNRAIVGKELHNSIKKIEFYEDGPESSQLLVMVPQVAIQKQSQGFNAHQVFDKLFLRVQSLKKQNKCPKSWKFKYKQNAEQGDKRRNDQHTFINKWLLFRVMMHKPNSCSHVKDLRGVEIFSCETYEFLWFRCHYTRDFCTIISAQSAWGQAGSHGVRKRSNTGQYIWVLKRTNSQGGKHSYMVFDRGIVQLKRKRPITFKKDWSFKYKPKENMKRLELAAKEKHQGKTDMIGGLKTVTFQS